MKAICISIGCFLGINGFSQMNYLVRVCDSESKRPLKNVTVKVDSSVIVSNAGGFFQVKGDTSMILQVSLDGYESSLLKLPTNEKFVFYLKRIETARDLELTKSFYKYVGENMKYPREARRAEIQGTSLIYFEVDTLGKIIKTEHLKRVGGGCSEEALRVLNKSPQVWYTIKQNTKFQFRVVFKMQDKLFPVEHFDTKPQEGIILLPEIVIVVYSMTSITPIR